MANISIHAPPRGATGRGVRDGRGVCISIHAPPRGATTAWRLTWSSGSDFNSRPSARGDGTRYAVHGANERFQFTPLREGRPHGVAAMQRRGIFQFTLLREGRRLTGVPLSTLTLFQFTPLREGRPSRALLSSSPTLFQFTPLREGRRSSLRRGVRPTSISIHAPPRGATISPNHTSQRFVISIHAPPRGATRALLVARKLHLFQFTPLREGRRIYNPWIILACNFNSRPSARGDLFRLQRDYHGALISIHAPPRGATGYPTSSFAAMLFQFTPLREGRRCTPRAQTRTRTYFNSRPSARGDKHQHQHQRRHKHFNSRPSARGDSRTPCH